jgi:hypothetical protein
VAPAQGGPADPGAGQGGGPSDRVADDHARRVQAVVGLDGFSCHAPTLPWPTIGLTTCRTGRVLGGVDVDDLVGTRTCLPPLPVVVVRRTAQVQAERPLVAHHQGQRRCRRPHPHQRLTEPATRPSNSGKTSQAWGRASIRTSPCRELAGSAVNATAALLTSGTRSSWLGWCGGGVLGDHQPKLIPTRRRGSVRPGRWRDGLRKSWVNTTPRARRRPASHRPAGAEQVEGRPNQLPAAAQVQQAGLLDLPGAGCTHSTGPSLMTPVPPSAVALDSYRSCSLVGRGGEQAPTLRIASHSIRRILRPKPPVPRLAPSHAQVRFLGDRTARLGCQAPRQT